MVTTQEATRDEINCNTRKLITSNSPFNNKDEFPSTSPDRLFFTYEYLFDAYLVVKSDNLSLPVENPIEFLT